MYDDLDARQNVLAFDRMFRGWLYLLLNFILGTIYFTFLVTGLSIGLSLLIILIGFPILRLNFAAARWLTVFDRRFTAALLNGEIPYTAEAMYKTPGTLESLGYLFGKFALGIVSITALSLLVPFFILEMALVLGGVNTGQITAHLSQALVTGMTGFSGSGTMVEIPEKAKEKPKRQPTPLSELFEDTPAGDEDDAEVVYYLDDDGEIGTYRRSS